MGEGFVLVGKREEERKMHLFAAGYDFGYHGLRYGVPRTDKDLSISSRFG